MNERIKELYNQSGGLVRMYDGKLTYFPAYQKNVGNGNFEFSSFDPEKFAELIVKECIDIALTTKAEQLELVSDTEAFDSMPEGAKDHSFGRVVAVNQVVANIKEHFVVKE